MALTLNEYKQYYSRYPSDIIGAKIIADSMFAETRLTTFLLTIPNIIHPELIRHRAFSFAVSSNRAIPTSRMIDNCSFTPVWRTRALRGMQPGVFIDGEETKYTSIWHNAKQQAIGAASLLDDDNIAKELVNRLLGPFQVVNILVTGVQSAYTGFFNLRLHADAQLEIQVLASRMLDQYMANKPVNLIEGEWHTPFITDNIFSHNTLAVSAARCARTSYSMPNKNVESTFSADIRLFKQLVEPPVHASPLEHVATPLSIDRLYNIELPDGVSSPWYGNTYGWVQLRKFFELDYDIPDALLEQQKVVNTLKQYLKKE